MSLKPEALFQIAVLKLSKEVIAAPFRLRAFDRSRNHSGLQHMHEAARGIRAGCPDTELICGGRSINVELKAPGTAHLASHQPSAVQIEEMRLLRAAGAYAACAWSCAEVVAHWRAAGVPLAPNAELVALDRDLRMAGAAAKKAGAAPKSYAKRARRDDPAAIRRMMRAGGYADTDPNLVRNRTP